MKRKLYYIFWLALATAGGISTFQVYWAYSAYKINEDNFNKIATVALQHTVDNYILTQADLMTQPQQKTSFYFLSNDTNKMKKMMQQSGDPTAENARQLAAQMNPEKTQLVVKTDMPEQDKRMQMLLMSRFVFQSMNKPMQPDSLLPLYKKELAKNNIRIPVKLWVGDSTTTGIAAPTGTGKTTVIADFKDRGKYMLSITMLPIIVSFLLILLTAGCLWYMWRIIWQQRQLEDIKNDFINNMTHELKTPIAILKTTHESLHHFGAIDDREKTLRYLQLNSNELNKLESNVERILDITSYELKKKTINLQSTDLEELIAAAVTRFTLNEENNITLTYRLPSKTMTVDKYAVETILNNLLDNSIKYSDKKNTIIAVTVAPIPNGWELCVKDNGQGIPAQQIPFIFDKFFRVPTGNLHNIKGYGLGLSYVHELAKLMHGTIAVKSKAGIGTTITIQFTSL